MSKRLELTDDEIARAWFACGHAAAFWKGQGRSKWARAEKGKYDALSMKLDRLLDKPPPPKSRRKGKQ